MKQEPKANSNRMTNYHKQILISLDLLYKTKKFSFCSLFFLENQCYNEIQTNVCKISEVLTLKINLEVNADFDLDGNIRPRSITWEDGRVYEIDRVLDARLAPAMVAGGLGMRYICRIRGKTVKLFNDEGHWFMER